MYALCGLEAGQVTDNLREAMAPLVHPEDRQRIGEEFERMLAVRRARPVEFRIVRPDGAERVVQTAGKFILDREGIPVRCVGIFHDITGRRADETRLAQMQWQLNHVSRLATMGELAAGIAHEVNQPLCAIVNFAKACRNLASQETPDLAQISAWSEAIATAAARGGEVVRRLRGFARQSDGQRQRVTVQQLVGDALTLVQFEAQSRQVALRTDLPDEDLWVCVRPVQIHQVLVNLLWNALESLDDISPTEPTVMVYAQAAEEVRISVCDNGAGLSDAAKERLFEPFFTTKPEGLGMGLAISRTIIEAHEGRIWASANHDAGATFCFTLPTLEELP